MVPYGLTFLNRVIMNGYLYIHLFLDTRDEVHCAHMVTRHLADPDGIPNTIHTAKRCLRLLISNFTA